MNRFEPFEKDEAELIADGVGMLRPRDDASRIMRDAIEGEARRHVAELEAEERMAEAREREAVALLRANGFAEEMMGGGCMALSLYLPHGTQILATCFEGGDFPSTDSFMLGTYAPCREGMMSETLNLFSFSAALPREERAGMPFLLDALRMALAAGTAIDAAVAAMPEPPAETDDAALAALKALGGDAAADVKEREEIRLPGFKYWTDGIAQAFLVRDYLGRGAVIVSTLDGQEPPTAESWAVSVHLGNIRSDDDGPEEPLGGAILSIEKGEGRTLDAAVAAACAFLSTTLEGVQA